MITVEGGRGAFDKRKAQILERTTRRPAAKVSKMGATDNGVHSR
jgi:hypothetical protein